MKNGALFLLAALLGGLAALPVQAQQRHGEPKDPDQCLILCMPTFTAAPGWTFAPLDGATVVKLQNGVPQDTVEFETKSTFLMIFDVNIPTTIPRFGLYVELIWAPFADASCNPFTGYCVESAVIDEDEIRANPVVLEFGTSFALVKMKETNGWVSSDFEIIDQFGPAAEPSDASYYTHKLNLELDVGLGVFNWVDPNNWLHNVNAYGTLGYLATGLPDEGDVVPDNTQRYLTDAGPWSITLGLGFPIAPLTSQ